MDSCPAPTDVHSVSPTPAEWSSSEPRRSHEVASVTCPPGTDGVWSAGRPGLACDWTRKGRVSEGGSRVGGKSHTLSTGPVAVAFFLPPSGPGVRTDAARSVDGTIQGVTSACMWYVCVCVVWVWIRGVCSVYGVCVVWVCMCGVCSVCGV